MSFDPVIAAVEWEFEDFILEEYEEETQSTLPPEKICKYARAFRKWKEDLLDKYVRYNADKYSLGHARMYLLDGYFSHYAQAPQSHRDKVSSKGHTCLHQVLVEAYQELQRKQLRVVPEPIFQRPHETTSTKMLPQIAGITLGEIVVDEAEGE